MDGLLVGWGGEAIFFSADAVDKHVDIDEDAVAISTQRRVQLATWLASALSCNDLVRVHAMPQNAEYHAIQGTCAGILLWNESGDEFRRIIKFDAHDTVAADENLIWSVVEHYGRDFQGLSQPAVGWVGAHGKALAIRARDDVAFILKGGALVARLDLEGAIDKTHFAMLAERIGAKRESGVVLARAAMLPPNENGHQAIVLATRDAQLSPPLVSLVGNPEDASWKTDRHIVGFDGWVPIRISGTWDKVVSPAAGPDSQEAIALRSWLIWQSPGQDGGVLWFEGERVRFILELEGSVGFRLLANRPPCRISNSIADAVLEQFLAPGASEVSILELVTNASKLAEPLWYVPSLMADPRLKLESQADCLA
jgi:hypothetical protein